MTRDVAPLLRSNQEQAVAAWVNYLNQIRLDKLVDAVRQQDLNLQDALTSIREALQTIDVEVVGTGRGGEYGMHGFIAEVAEVGIGNARSQVLGQGSVYQLRNDNSYVDLVRNGIEIQQKFVVAGGRFSLGAVLEHLEKYPDFVTNGGKYQIPGDHFDVIERLHAMSQDEAGRVLTRGGDGPSFKDWERVQAFFDKGAVGIESIEPSALDYSEVQRGAYESRLGSEEESLRATDKSQREAAHQDSLPSLREGVQATAVGAVVEGGAAFVMAVIAKRRNGTPLNAFTREDWSDIAGDTGYGFVKGGVRGLTIYSLTNVTATPAAVASAIVTAGFGIAELAFKLRRGELTELQFIENAEIVALEAAISALSSVLGQALIPVPILGAVIGNTVGTVMYQTVAAQLSRREAELIARYLEEQRALDEQLAAEYQVLIDKLDDSMATYLDVLGQAFSPDVAVALRGSVQLARELGVASEEILDSDEKTFDYFLS